jgi:SWI/SNF-related matrix-associated actin-dependent regulator 1 of chromatin subfamily A
MKLLTKPFEYQREGVDLIHETGGRTLLADEMGLGKSLQALVYALETKPFPAIVVCPAFLKYNWEREIRNHLGCPAEVLDGQRPHRGRVLKSKFYIVNYDILHFWVNWLRKLDPQLIIPDEIHACGNPETIRTKALQKLCRGVPHVIAVSGTPLENRPIELWPTLNIIWPKKFRSRLKYGFRYCKPQFVRGEMQFKGAENLPHLHKRLKQNGMIRRLKSEVLKDLPPKIRTIVPLDIQNRKEYLEAETDLIKWLAKSSKTKANKARKAERFVQYNYLRALAGRLKIPSDIQWIENFLDNGDQKLIVYANHYAVIDPLYAHFHATVGAVRVTGKVTGRARDNAFQQFQTDKSIRILVANWKAGSEGWSCKANAAVVGVELPWKPARCEQGEDRIHGVNRGMAGVSASIYYLIAHGTVEERLSRLLQEKAKVIKAVLDGAKDVQDFDIFDRLEEELCNANAQQKSAVNVRIRKRSAGFHSRR